MCKNKNCPNGPTLNEEYNRLFHDWQSNQEREENETPNSDYLDDPKSEIKPECDHCNHSMKGINPIQGQFGWYCDSNCRDNAEDDQFALDWFYTLEDESLHPV